MSPSKAAVLFLAVLLAAPSTVAWAADPCDDALVSKAVLTPKAKRVQLAATQLVTKEMYDKYRSNLLTGKLVELLGRSLADFNSFDALVDWRKLEASKDFFEYGADSARAAILAASHTTAVGRGLAGSGLEDFFFVKWKRCQLDELMKQPLPVFRGWLDKVEPEQVTVRLVASVEPDKPPPAISIQHPPGVRPESPTQSTSAGRLTVERLVTVKRQPKLDVRVIATIGNITSSVVVPSVAAATGLGAPQMQSSDPSRQARVSVSHVVPIKDPKDEPTCYRAREGETFDVKTIRVTASPQGGGTWKVMDPKAEVICVMASAKEGAKDPKAMPYTVILRLEKIVRTARAAD
jgi:hypothetical protein